MSTDHKALIEEARATVAGDYDDSTSATQGYRRRAALLRLADAVESLVAERDALRTQLDSMTKRHASALGAISRVRANVMTTDGDYLDGQSFDGLAGEIQAALGSWLVEGAD